MTTTTIHWTSRSIDDFVYRIASDFVVQLEKRMEKDGISQEAIAVMLGVTPGRVSQVLNNPGNLTLKKIVEYSRILGLKVMVVAYDDGDPENEKGPISPEVFTVCWNRAGKPRDFFALAVTEPKLETIKISKGMSLIATFRPKAMSRRSTPVSHNPTISPYTFTYAENGAAMTTTAGFQLIGK